MLKWPALVGPPVKVTESWKVGAGGAALETLGKVKTIPMIAMVRISFSFRVAALDESPWRFVVYYSELGGFKRVDVLLRHRLLRQPGGFEANGEVLWGTSYRRLRSALARLNGAVSRQLALCTISSYAPGTPPELLALGSQQLELIATRLVVAPVVRVLTLELLGRQLDLASPKHRPALWPGPFLSTLQLDDLEGATPVLAQPPVRVKHVRPVRAPEWRS